MYNLYMKSTVNVCFKFSFDDRVSEPRIYTFRYDDRLSESRIHTVKSDPRYFKYHITKFHYHLPFSNASNSHGQTTCSK